MQEALIKYQLVKKRLVVLFKCTDGYIVDFDFQKKQVNPQGWKQTIFASSFLSSIEAETFFDNLVNSIEKGSIDKGLI